MKLILFILLISISVCHAQRTIKNGTWRGVLLLNENKQIELPFNFEIKNTINKASKSSKINPNYKWQLVIQNAQEYITVTEIYLKKDSFNFKMPVFDSEFKCQLVGDTLLKGVWINHAKKENNSIPFTAKYGQTPRFQFPAEATEPIFNGKWEVTFSPNTKDSSKAIGVFTQPYGGSNAFGTFLTETGDYRYLDGMVHHQTLYLSAFDGAHAFLFIAEVNSNEIIHGTFYSGNSWEESWQAHRNEKFELRNPESITQVKLPDAPINFSFPNLLGKKISLTDARYKNKAVIIQIMGSWCPNCMDETAYLADLYKRYKPQGLEIIALAYERTPDFKKAVNNVIRLKTKFNAQYEFLITGLTGKTKASESLPFLNEISAFPTTIVLDKNHQVKTIYTGFSGPATEEEYIKFKTSIEKVITILLK